MCIRDRTGSGSTTTPSTAGSWSEPTGPSSRAPGSSTGTTTRPSQAGSTPAASSEGYMPGNSGGAEATRPGGTTQVPSTPEAPSGWGGSQSGSQGGSTPNTDLGSQERPSTPGEGRPDSSLNGGSSGSSSGGHTRPSTGSSGSGSQGSSSGGHTRPSTGSTGSSSGGHTRPSTGGAQSGGHTRPSAGHQRPSTPQASGHPHRHHHTRPTTGVHHWYYGNRGPVVNVYHQRPVYWYHGVWVYGPAPAQHYYYNDTTTVQPEARPELPERRVNRNDSFMVGVHGAQMAAGYDGGGTFVDPGVGVSFAYRPVETFSIGLDYSYFNPVGSDGFTPRETANIAPNISIHAVPWKRVSPYAEFGMTASRRIYNDQWSQNGEQFQTDVSGTAWGPHAALGLEVAIGKSLALDVSGKYVGYVNVEGDDPSAPSALQGNLGLNIYF